MATITKTLSHSSLARNLARSLTATRPSAADLPQRRFASGDYGSGTGDPKGEHPKEQGPNPSADKEHPGPPPPKAGQGSGSTTKATTEGHEKELAEPGPKAQLLDLKECHQNECGLERIPHQSDCGGIQSSDLNQPKD